MVPLTSNKITRVPFYSIIIFIFEYGAITLFSKTFQFISKKNIKYIFGLIRVLSPILTESLLIFFPKLLRCFNSLSFNKKILGFPIRKFTNYRYRYLLVTFRFLSRPFLLVPRHPSSALFLIYL